MQSMCLVTAASVADPLIPDPDLGIRDKHLGSYFKSLVSIFFCLKKVNFLLQILIRDSVPFWPWIKDPGSGMENFGSGIIIPNPQHCSRGCLLPPGKTFVTGGFLVTVWPSVIVFGDFVSLFSQIKGPGCQI
jgi:hypothetical protein